MVSNITYTEEIVKERNPNFSSKLFFKPALERSEGKEKSPLSTTPLPPFIKGDGAGGLYQKK